MENLYLIRCNDFYKIGIAGDMRARLGQLQIGNPYKLQLRACFQFPNALGIESVLHQRFAACRGLGEWFKLSAEDLEIFLTLCRMLGGVELGEFPNAAEPDCEVVEEIPNALGDGQAWDYEAMTARGWFFQTVNTQVWHWRKRAPSVYGGRIVDLPCSVGEMEALYGPR